MAVDEMLMMIKKDSNFRCYLLVLDVPSNKTEKNIYVSHRKVERNKSKLWISFNDSIGNYRQSSMDVLSDDDAIPMPKIEQ